MIDSTRGDRILAGVDAYYSEKVRVHGPTPKGVDWNSIESQHLRFMQLSSLLPGQQFSICDFGCGYGSYYDFLAGQHPRFEYRGVDISADMIEHARNQHAGVEHCRFDCSNRPVSSDYVVASGIFNVRQQIPDREWLEYIFGCVEAMSDASGRGFAFNCLTSYSDADRKRDYLYYADPRILFDHCMRLSRHVTLLHGYGLYEFTILVRKEQHGE
ncbi:class I SAM-dependent methyltransferase [Cognatiluteimonas profundi]|uniref:class I SAM-dependent methyltransferase n=1 Tax=Cognatiluteimonas profundi TaxID=2594501 RepID=UPI00131C6C20|nr:class I SAM-dependent methyltransferase [Lysobacter profundi]